MNREDFDLHEASLFAELSDVIELKSTEGLRDSPFARQQYIMRDPSRADGCVADAGVRRDCDSLERAELAWFLDREMACGRTSSWRSRWRASLPDGRFVECVLARLIDDLPAGSPLLVRALTTLSEWRSSFRRAARPGSGGRSRRLLRSTRLRGCEQAAVCAADPVDPREGRYWRSSSRTCRGSSRAFGSRCCFSSRLRTRASRSAR
jgi:hypothetical protein